MPRPRALRADLLRAHRAQRRGELEPCTRRPWWPRRRRARPPRGPRRSGGVASLAAVVVFACARRRDRRGRRASEGGARRGTSRHGEPLALDPRVSRTKRDRGLNRRRGAEAGPAAPTVSFVCLFARDRRRAHRRRMSMMGRWPRRLRRAGGRCRPSRGPPAGGRATTDGGRWSGPVGAAGCVEAKRPSRRPPPPRRTAAANEAAESGSETSESSWGSMSAATPERFILFLSARLTP